MWTAGPINVRTVALVDAYAGDGSKMRKRGPCLDARKWVVEGFSFEWAFGQGSKTKRWEIRNRSRTDVIR